MAMMKWEKKALFLGGIGVLLSLAYCAGRPEPASPSQVVHQQSAGIPVSELNAALQTMLGQLEPTWASVEFEESQRSMYKVRLTYGFPPSANSQIEGDTKLVARAALDTLRTKGVDPYADQIFLSVWASRPVTGETGQSMIRIYGSTTYSYVNDSLSYKPFR